MDDSMTIDGNRVRELREARAWSQDHLASVAGVGLRTVQRVEAEHTASFETRMAIAAAFGLAPDALLTAVPTAPAVADGAHRRTRDRLGLAHAVLWATAIVAAAAAGGSPLLTTVLLPALAIGALFVVDRGLRAR